MMFFINRLSEEELKKFELFINSPYLNSNKNVVLVFNYLKPFYPNITSEHLSDLNISLGVFNENTVNEVKIRKVKSDYSDVMEKFIVQNDFHKDKSTYNLMLLRAYRAKNSRKKYHTLLNKNRKVFEKTYVTNENIYSDMYKTEEENFNYLFYTADKRIASAYKKKTEALDHFLVYQKLKNYYDYIISEVFLTKDMEVEKLFVKDMLGYVERDLDDIKKHHPYIYLYYLLALFYEEYDMKYLSELNRYYDISNSKFSRELFHTYNNAIISAYLKMKSKKIGDVRVLKEKLFVIYDRFFMKEPDEFSKYYGELPFLSSNFLSIANTAITLYKLDWAKEFMDKYRNSMKDELSNDCYNVCMMDYNYYLKNYKDAIFYGTKVSGKFPNYYYTSMIMVIRAHYELGDLDSVHTVFDNLKQYLKRRKNINEYDHNYLKAFITYFTKFIKLTETSSVNSYKIKKSKKLLELKYEIEKEGEKLDSYKWFMEKLTME